MKIYKILTLAVICLISINSFAQDFISQNRVDNYKLYQLPNIYSMAYKMHNDSPKSDAPMSTIKENFFLTLRDGVQMDASKFYPSDTNIYLPGGYPIVIMVHGYGDRKETLENFAQAQAFYGYVVYTYSVRGQGNSGGLSNLMSRTEAQDLIELVNYVKLDKPNTRGDSANILIMGGSQGGTIPYMAASMGMKVRCIISALSSPTFASSWIENGSIKTTLLWTIGYTPDTARYNAQVTAMTSWIYSNAADKWDSLAQYLPADRDFDNIIANNTVPICLENSWQDMFFNASGNINGIHVMSAPSRYYFGAVMGHGGDTSPTEDLWHMNYFNEWFYYWLYPWYGNINLLNRPKYHYAFTTYPVNGNMWSFAHDSSSVWPPAGSNNMRLYFNKKVKDIYQLSKTSNLNQNDKAEFKNEVKDKYTMEQIVADEFTGKNFTKNFKVDNEIFETGVLTTNMKMIGAPTLRLDYSAEATAAQFNFQIYEVDNKGVAKFVTSINYTDRKNIKNKRKQATIAGNSHAHIFSAGSKIRVILTNLDRRPNYAFLGTNPYVLPVMLKSNNKIYLSADSYIDFPIVGAAPFSTMLSAEDNGTVKVTKFDMSQNYPNPFNPTTNISFTLPENFAGNVMMKVFDITGKEVATLVNTQMNSGIHSVAFDGSKLSSGIYFYKINAGSYSDVKRMLLVK